MDIAGRSKRRRSTSSRSVTVWSKKGKDPYCLKGLLDDEWHLWNVGPNFVTFNPGDVLSVYILASSFHHSTLVKLRVLLSFSLRSSSEKSVTRGIHFDFLQGDVIPDPESVAKQIDFLNMCGCKGVDASLFLEHCVHRHDDEELRLGSELWALFIGTVHEMLDRGYDVMHHYPLFNCVLSIHYADKLCANPPALSAIVAKGGLLDQSAKQHEEIHGIPLFSSDHIRFSSWNQPFTSSILRIGKSVQGYKTPVKNELQLNSDVFEACTSRCSGYEHQCKNMTSDKSGVNSEGHDPLEESNERSSKLQKEDKQNQKQLCSGKQHVGEEKMTEEEEEEEQPGESRESISLRAENAGTEELYISEIRKMFNDLPNTLTDGSIAFPYMFKIPGYKPTFAELVNYCVTSNPESLGVLPSGEKWGSVNPVMLMEDMIDPALRRNVHRYVITSRGHLSTIVADDTKASFHYNEVFLPGRPVSRLNLDIDLKCCQRCNFRFSVQADTSVKREVSNVIVSSLIMVLIESLLRITNLKGQYAKSSSEFHGLERKLGKIAVYWRVSSEKPKLSFRMLWYLPVELCSFEGIEAYRSLFLEIEKTSLKYTLLSYPVDSETCELCQLALALREQEGDWTGFRNSVISSECVENRRSSIDRAPYSHRKCVRLPNCYKNSTKFEYIDTFNRHGMEDPGFEDPRSLSVGLSSNPILVDVSSLGPLFRGVLDRMRHSRQSLFLTQIHNGYVMPKQDRVQIETRRLSVLWGVPVTVKTSGSGLVYIQATEKSTTYPCPVHNRVHSKARLSALVFAECTKQKCFVC